MAYAWKIELNDVDISAKVSRFQIVCSLTSFCRELSLDIADPDLYAGLDFSQISEAPEIEVFTKAGEDWISQGAFFIERPALAVSVASELLQGVWGRSVIALLAEPFAPKVTKSWEERTTFYDICEEMCDLVGLAWDSAYSGIANFVIYPYTYEASGVYPIDVISELAGFAGGLVTTDREGHLCIRQIEYSPAAADATITDDDIQSLSESPEWPAFGNRVRITPTGEEGSYSAEISIPGPCLPADGVSRAKLYVQIRDQEGEPVNGMVVDWEIESEEANLQWMHSNTQEIVISNERQRASDFHTVETAFPPGSVDGVYAYADTAKSHNYAAEGYELDGKSIVLAEKLDYCDQSLVITYRVHGMAINYATAGEVAEDATVTASVEGQADSGTVYIDNPCACPPEIRLTAAPTSIYVGGEAALLAYVEESGPVAAGRTLFMAETSAAKRGTLSWTTARLGTVSVRNEKAVAINEIAGVSQCEISMFPSEVASVYEADEDGNPTGGDLYSSHNGKVIDLSEHVETGTDLLVSYTAQGAALNFFTGSELGRAALNARIVTNREDGAEAATNVQIVDETATTDDYPEDWEEGDGDGGYGGVGGDNDEEEDEVWDPGETGEPTSDFNWCVSENVSENPTEEALAARFTVPLEHDCECAQVCESELYIYDTIQSYDGASQRPLSQIVVEDYGLAEGSPAYWEKLEELKAVALALCVSECEGCDPPMEWSEYNSETIGREDQLAIQVTHGVGPFHWTVGGQGFTLEVEETEDGVNLLNTDNTACGAAGITVIDACGVEVKGYVRCTYGQWVFHCEGENSGSSCAGRKNYEEYPDLVTKLVLGVGCHYSPFECTYFSCGGYTAYIPSAANNKCGTTDWEIDCGFQGSACRHANVYLTVYKWECV